MTRELVILDGPEAVAQAGAERFVAASARALSARPRFVVVLAGGSTPRAMFARLAAAPLVTRVDWSRVEIWFGDERAVPPDHPDSNFRMVKEALLERVPIPPAQVHRIAGELPPEEAARAYDRALANVVFDLVLLGLGADGHTASLFPGSSALTETRARAVSVWVERLHSFRVTLTALELSSAGEAVVMALGHEKAAALALALEGAPGSVPIQLVKPARMIWLVDQQAASNLRGPL